MSLTVIVTGSATGIENLTARALAVAGHTVFASMRDPEGSKAAHARGLRDFASARKAALHVIELDVRSQASADSAIASVIDNAGHLDVVVNNPGHLVIGYAEAFTAEDLATLFDVNVFGMQRVNRAALPHLRVQGSGLLVYVGSTSTVSLPPFLAPYVASKAAFDALAATTAYEVGQFGIESTIVMPGAFTSGTAHYPNSTRASDDSVSKAYVALDQLVARNEAATVGLYTPGADPDPKTVADEIVRIVSLPAGERPRPTVVDFTNSDVVKLNDVMATSQDDFVTRMGFEELLHVNMAVAVQR